MSSKINICNMALMDFKARPVVDIDSPTTNEEQLFHTIFEQTAKSVIMKGSWTSCIARQDLVATANTPVFGSNYEFQLPTNPLCLKVLQFEPCGYPYSIEGDKLYTDSDTAQIKFICYNTNIASWDPMLVDAVVAALKTKIAGPLTADPRRMQYVDQKALGEFFDALAVNNQQGSLPEDNDPTMFDIRD